MRDPPPDYNASSSSSSGKPQEDSTGSVRVDLEGEFEDDVESHSQENKAPISSTKTYGVVVRKGGCCSGCRKVGLLMYKNFLVRRRHKLACFCEFAFPLYQFLKISLLFGFMANNAAFENDQKSDKQFANNTFFSRISNEKCMYQDFEVFLNLSGNSLGRSGKEGGSKMTKKSMVIDCHTKSYLV